MNVKYPQWLLVILQNDYGDDDGYWYDVDTSDEEFKEAYLKLKSLKRKYSDYSKWRAACNVYDDYIDVIIEHNGGEYAVQSMFKSDIIPEGWVPRPKLKNKKSNKEILHSGLTLSKVSANMEDIHIINELACQENRLTPEIRESIPNVMIKPKGEIKAAINKGLEITEEKRRVSMMYKEYAERSMFDVLSTYYSESEYLDEEAKFSSLSEMFDAAISDMYDAENDDGWRFTRDYMNSRHKGDFRHNQIHTRQDLYDVDIARKIFEDNNLIVFDTDNMSKERVKLYKTEFGMDFDPKARKKYEKEYKKYEKERMRREKNSLDLARALTRNQDFEIDLSKEKFTLNDYRKKYKK